MALVVKDRVKETTATTGTGTLTLAGAVTGFQSFSSALSDGDTTYYAIFESSTGEWEVGLGTFTASGTTLARTTVLASSNSGSAVNLTAGAADVFITQPATKAAYFDGSGDLILNQDPTSNLQAATKQYVDTIAAAGLHYHAPVRVQTTGNLSATYDNGSSGVGATLTNSGTQAAISVDNVTLSSADRVLVSEQTNAAHNGVYTVTTVGSGSTNWVLTRATDADSYGPSDPDALGEGDAFFIKEGDTNAGHLDVMTTSGTITFGTTNIVFSEVAETTVYSAGDGLTLTGTTFAAGAGTGVTVNANDIAIGQDVGTTANVTFSTVTADLTGDVTGDLTGNVTGNADTATAWATGRTISLTGDITGSATGVDGSGNVSIATTYNNDVVLGTDTSGNYVASGAVSGNGLSGSASAESATFTVTSNATNANTASTIVFRDASGNFSAGTITADLNGNASTATSATDADTVDSLHASQFLRSDANDTTTGQLTVDNDNGIKVISGTETANVYYTGYGIDSARSTTYIRPQADNTQTLYIGSFNDALDWNSIQMKVGSNDNVTINGNKVFHQANLIEGTTFSGTYPVLFGIDNATGRVFENNNITFDGTANNLDVNGSVTADNIYVASTVRHEGDTDTYLGYGTDTIELVTGGTQRFQVNSSGVRLGDSGNGYFQPVSGNYGSIQIDGGAHGGYEGYSIGGRIVLMHDNSSTTYLYNDVDNEAFIRMYNNGSVSLYNNGSVKLSTTSTGVNIDGDLNAVDNIAIANSIYHEGDTDTYLYFGTNSAYISTGGSDRIIANSSGVRLGDSGNGYFQPVSGNFGSIQIDGGAHGGYEGYSIGGRAVFMHDNSANMGLYDDVNNKWAVLHNMGGSTYIYDNGAVKINTTSTGVNVTGTAEVDTLTFSDGSSQTSAGASTGKAIAMAIVFG